MLDNPYLVPIIFILFCLALCLPKSIREGNKKGRDMVKRRSIRIDTEWLDLDSGECGRKVREHHRETGVPVGGQNASSSPTDRVARMMGGQR